MHGNGVVVFETSRVFGGDSTMIYVGNYQVENGLIQSKININNYAHVPGMSSVVNLDSFNLQVTGEIDSKEMVLSGYVVEDSSRKITIKTLRRAELP